MNYNVDASRRGGRGVQERGERWHSKCRDQHVQVPGSGVGIQRVVAGGWGGAEQGDRARPLRSLSFRSEGLVFIFKAAGSH